MKITDDVIADLLPLYYSGECSADTKLLVEQYFRENPDFEKQARLPSKEAFPQSIPQLLVKNDEMKSLAKTRGSSANRVIVELIESGIEAQQQERKRFLELADRLARSRNTEEQTRLKEELAVMTFGE